MASIEEIRAQLFNYIQAVDRIDYELGTASSLKTAFDYGSYYYDIFPNMTGRQFIDSCLGDHLNGCKWTHHMYSAMRIDVNVDNGTAGSSTYGHINQIFSPDGKAQATGKTQTQILVMSWLTNEYVTTIFGRGAMGSGSSLSVRCPTISPITRPLKPRRA